MKRQSRAVEIISRIQTVPAILDTICTFTGMGFAAIARVTARKWIARAVRDGIGLGLLPGGDLKLDTTISNEIRKSGRSVVIPDTQADPVYRDHQTPRLYGFRSYISIPLLLSDSTVWGTLCAIDPEPRDLDRPDVRDLLEAFADLLACDLNLTGMLDD